eukprot:NODE_646_length_1733_cov_2.095890_g636_i0.p1 GENE.NODE_646_length_1733_cov_2.095890_g636_i0~~NODE_646_length_1733_cov_2.095890_g636_i0.p1  ORF type:complete len:565 (-),score=131.43 NODE_646_length_1733_cov_2.095890_g636_i0:37-1611(-)
MTTTCCESTEYVLEAMTAAAITTATSAWLTRTNKPALSADDLAQLGSLLDCSATGCRRDTEAAVRTEVLHKMPATLADLNLHDANSVLESGVFLALLQAEDLTKEQVESVAAASDNFGRKLLGLPAATHHKAHPQAVLEGQASLTALQNNWDAFVFAYKTALTPGPLAGTSTWMERLQLQMRVLATAAPPIGVTTFISDKDLTDECLTADILVAPSGDLNTEKPPRVTVHTMEGEDKIVKMETVCTTAACNWMRFDNSDTAAAPACLVTVHDTAGNAYKPSKAMFVMQTQALITLDWAAFTCVTWDPDLAETEDLSDTSAATCAITPTAAKLDPVVVYISARSTVPAPAVPTGISDPVTDTPPDDNPFIAAATVDHTPERKRSLSGGEIAGIICACLGFVVAILLGTIAYQRWKTRKDDRAFNSNGEQPTNFMSKHAEEGSPHMEAASSGPWHLPEQPNLPPATSSKPAHPSSSDPLAPPPCTPTGGGISAPPSQHVGNWKPPQSEERMQLTAGAGDVQTDSVF